VLTEINLDEGVDLSSYFKCYNIFLRGSSACFVSDVYIQHQGYLIPTFLAT